MSDQKGTIFLIERDGQLTALNETDYDSEMALQELLAKFPALLAGEQIDQVEPRRWILVKREMGVPGDESRSNRWSIDHLFLDQDATPTLVEVKRSTDTRLRREVIGQMLDYASNGVAYWGVDDMRSWYEQSCSEEGLDATDEVERFSEVGDADEYWEMVKVNLQAGKMRLLFVADVIPRELKRVIEFLNEQMDPAEVLGVEIKQYQARETRTLVPKVIGATSSGEIKRKQARSTRSASSRERLLESLETKHGTRIASLAKRIIDSMSDRVDEVRYSEGKTGATAHFHCSSINPPLFNIRDTGTLGFPMRRLHKRAPFNDERKLAEFAKKLEAVPGFETKEKGIKGLPRIVLGSLGEEDVDRVIEVLNWEVEQFRVAEEGS